MIWIYYVLDTVNIGRTVNGQSRTGNGQSRAH